MQPPRRINYHRQSKRLDVEFADHVCSLPAELLRVYSPSAEVRGHSGDERVLQTGKKHVAITGIEPVGNYAIRISFDDGHDSGIYAWEYLLDLDRNQDQYWQAYLAELKEANASRLPTIPVGQWTPKP
ncbi:MAG: DUF971 domain-containing protein [Pseudomonadales bacterium]|jgi:DUF971 family protein